MQAPPRCFIVKSFTPYASLEVMLTDIGYALQRRHMVVTDHLHSNFPNFELFKRQFAQISKHDGRRLVIDENSEHNYRTDGRSLYDVWNLPRFSFITDNPVRKLDLLKAFPDIGLAGVVDLDFLEIWDEFRFPGRGVIPFPHGGPDALPELPSTAERDIDVLLVGNISSALSTEDWLNASAGTDPLLRTAYQRAFDRSVSGDESLWRILRSEFADAGVTADADFVAAAVCHLETHLIAHRRRAILHALNGRKVAFYGNQEEGETLSVSDDVAVNDILPFRDVVDLMMRSKIVLNISPSFRNGAHERVFYGLSRGAFILAEPTRFLRREMEEGLGVSFLPYDVSQVMGAVDALLDRPDEELDAMRARAVAHYQQNHTWGHRVDAMLEAVSKEFWSA
ncbi:MAG: glycosyltransferase [Alphaproteobacteria bacterium]|nr:glycosyltransferase [Alphaproteobacteria bacterium]